MTPEELAIAHQIMAKAEQRYFHLLGEADRSIGPTGGSWPGDVAASKMEPVMLEGLPGTLSLKYMLELRRDQFLSIIPYVQSHIDLRDEPLNEAILWYHGSNEIIKVDLQLRKNLRQINKIDIAYRKGDKWYDIIYSKFDESGQKIDVITRTLSPEAFEYWKRQIEEYKK